MIIIDLRRNPPPSPISEYIIEEKISEIPIKTINWMKFVSTVDQGFQKNNGRKVERRLEQQGIVESSNYGCSQMNNRNIRYQLFLFTLAELKLIEAIFLSCIE